MKSNPTTLTLFNDETFVPVKYNSKEIVERLINYIYITLRKRKHSEETIVKFIRDLFPINLTDIIDSLPYATDDDLTEILMLAKEHLIKENNKLLNNWTQEEIDQVNTLFDDIVENAKSDSSFFNITREVLIESLKRISKNQIYPKDSFLLPSNKNIFSIIDLFAGKTNKIPRTILIKPKAERTQEEEEIVQSFIQSIIKEEIVGFNEDGSQRSTHVAIISDTPKTTIHTAPTLVSNLDDYDNTNYENIATYITQTFGAEGFRHFLAIVAKCSENIHSGTTRWNINEHLQLLGIAKKKNGSYKIEAKEKAIEMLRMFISLHICFLNKDNNTEVLNVRQLFTIVGFDITTDLKSHLSKEDIVIRADESWFFFNKSQKSSKAYYTHVLKNLLKENSQLYPHIFTLSTLLAIFWRIEMDKKVISVRKLLQWCKIDLSDRTAKQAVMQLEKHLEQMVIQGYLGKWINTTSPNIHPSETTAPLDQIIEFHPPLWLQEEFSNLKRKNDTSVALPKVFRALTNEEFNEVIRKSGLTIREFAEKLGVSRQTVSYLRSGKKKVSNELTAKIWLTFPEFFTQP